MVDNNERCKMEAEAATVKKVVVDNMPASCGECPLFRVNYHGICYYCSCGALPKGDNNRKVTIESNPYDMTYRRSDCPLVVEDKELLR